MIINDQQTLLDSMHATVNIKLENPQIFQYVFMDFLKNNGSEFHQKLIGTIIRGLMRHLRAQCGIG